MTKSLRRRRHRAPGIRVLSISPGVVDNDFIRSWTSRWLGEQDRCGRRSTSAMPEEVASAVIAGDQDSPHTGSIIPVDGGRPLVNLKN